MRTKNWSPNAAERRWQNNVRALGSIISGRTPVEIHHCAGAAARHNRIHIGQYWVLPLTYDEHLRIAELGHDRKTVEKNLFKSLCFRYLRRYGGVLPVPNEVMRAIEDWHR